MAVRAFILIETEAGMSRDVASELRELSWVEVVDRVAGPYDVIAVVGAADLRSLGDLIADSIHTLRGIVSTVTGMALSGD